MAPNDIQAELRSLSIPQEQRPHAGTPVRRRSRRGGLAIGLIVIAGAGLTGYTFRRSLAPIARELASTAGNAAAVRVLLVTETSSSEPMPLLTATGKIVSDHRVVVATKVSGQVVALFFEQGDRVEQGRVLARIEDVLYRARRDEAAARLQRSEANLVFQKTNYERVSGLLKSQSAPDIEYADAKRALDEAKAQVAADRASLAFAEKTFHDCEVAAPISGVILTRNVEVGDFVAAEGGIGANANAQFATIADMTMLRVEVDISELDITRLHKDMPCLIVPDAYKGRRYNGYIMWIDPGANYSKATVQVKVRIEAPDEFLRVEGSAQVSFLAEKPGATAESDRPTIWIPTTACLLDPTSKSGTVFAVSDGRFRKTTVEIGRRLGERIEVTSGLSAGQSIAADGLEKLSEGQRVPS
ncbi:MAG: efflux RND transporter periplasmic adaptor subunit [Phycisphaerales bacterium]|nr:efflux RND transporter periplasmic adaptor subunit [Phycisphaerales bacterium]